MKTPTLYIRYQEDTDFKYEFYHDNCEGITNAFSRQYYKEGKCMNCSFKIPSILLLDETDNYIVRFATNGRLPGDMYNRGMHYPIYLDQADQYKLIPVL